ncbi:MAG: hypothetical protein KIH64_009320 [Mycobacterium sp.]|nr:hypothetical protein [Mycobacterium sp.]
MKRPVLLSLLVASVAALAALFFVMRTAVDKAGEHAAPAAVRNVTVELDGQPFTLKDGVAAVESAPGSAAKNTVRIVGEPAVGDATGEGEQDAALLIANDPGGSGTFYYAVLAVNHGGAYQATNAVALGDRIVPQGIDFTDGHFVFHFLDRKSGESMADEPTVEEHVKINIDPKTNRISVG